ncbi:hypothetical protein DSO57_1011626 [Entomophthora muscae]|uniref:Uncharacterized protein n=1 Tax=Entomophthora muscae TaxID=34485 RepID=A0ACC2US44_9FUNG|nr:hypothetical protein DSO57_1011626 [Entomophthora muscae]
MRITFLVALCQALPNAPLRVIKLGGNPSGYNYYLPDGAKWSGGPMFIQNHYLSPVSSDTQCVENGGTTYCITEHARYLNVTTTGQTFPSHCWFSDCYIKVQFPSLVKPLVAISRISPEPIFTLNAAPYLSEQRCNGSSPIMHAPGWVYPSLQLYHIYLVVHLKIIILVDGKEMRSTQVIFNTLSVTDTGECDSFITHKL